MPATAEPNNQPEIEFAGKLIRQNESGAAEVYRMMRAAPSEVWKWRGSNQGNTQKNKFLYLQSFIYFRCYLEMALFEPRQVL
jgi:hypothetical protein